MNISTGAMQSEVEPVKVPIDAWFLGYLHEIWEMVTPFVLFSTLTVCWIAAAVFDRQRLGTHKPAIRELVPSSRSNLLRRVGEIASALAVIGTLLLLVYRYLKPTLSAGDTEHFGSALMFAGMGLAFVFSRRMWIAIDDKSGDIFPVEMVYWSWRGALKGSVVVVVAFAGVLLIPGEWPVELSWIKEAIMVLAFFGVTTALMAFLLSAYRVKILEVKAVPNLGIAASLRNCLGIGWRAFLFFVAADAVAMLASPLTEWQSRVLFVVLPAVGVALLAAAVFGGLEVLRHYVLRLLLARDGDLPMNLMKFLNYCSEELRILQRVGGGYIFQHRYLLEYFADFQESPGKRNV